MDNSLSAVHVLACGRVFGQLLQGHAFRREQNRHLPRSAGIRAGRLGGPARMLFHTPQILPQIFLPRLWDKHSTAAVAVRRPVDCQTERGHQRSQAARIHLPGLRSGEGRNHNLPGKGHGNFRNKEIQGLPVKTAVSDSPDLCPAVARKFFFSSFHRNDMSGNIMDKQDKLEISRAHHRRRNSRARNMLRPVQTDRKQ